MANQNIPGVSFEFKDTGRLVPVITGPITDSVLIIGNAVDGPVNVPVRVTGKNVEQIFGPVAYDALYESPNGDKDLGRYNGNNLVKAYAEVVMGGCTNVMLMRIGDEDALVKQSTPALATYTADPSSPLLDTFAIAGTGANRKTVAEALGIGLKAIYPGRVYDGLGLVLECTMDGSAIATATLTVRQDIRRKGRKLTYTLKDASVTLTKRDLIRKINEDLRNTTLVASSVTGDTALDDDIPFAGIAEASRTQYWVLTGGTDGVRSDFGATALAQAQRIYQALMGSAAAVTSGDPTETSPFARLEGAEPDIVYLAALYADENVGDETVPVSIAVPFAKALHVAATNDYPMVGVIGTAPVVDSVPASVSAVVDRLLTARSSTASDAVVPNTNSTKLNMGWFVGEDPAAGTTAFDWIDPDSGESVDLGRYVLMVAGPDVVLSNPKLGQYVETGAGVYAGLLSTVPPYRAVTNMNLPGVRRLAWSFTNKQLNKVAGGQPYDEATKTSGSGGSYVVWRRDVSGNIVVNLDNSCASRDSDYASYQILYIVNEAASRLKRVAMKFIGMAAHTTTKSALENQVDAALKQMAESRAISGYDFEITASGVDQLLGRINIDLTLRPALQIKSIRVTISVAPPNGA